MLSDYSADAMSIRKFRAPSRARSLRNAIVDRGCRGSEGYCWYVNGDPNDSESNSSATVDVLGGEEVVVLPVDEIRALI
jgi:hypothetical protein